MLPFVYPLVVCATEPESSTEFRIERFERQRVTEHPSSDTDQILTILGLPEPEQKRSLPSLIQSALDTESVARRFAAVWTLGRVNVMPATLGAVIDVLSNNLSAADEDEWVRGESATSLGLLCEPNLEFLSTSDNDKALNALLKLAVNRNPWLRERAIIALTPWRTKPSVQDILRNAFLDPIPMVRDASLRAGLYHEQYLVQALSDEDPGVRFSALGWIRRLGGALRQDLRPLLIERLHDPYGPVVAEAMHQLAASRNPELVQPILELLNKGEGWHNAVRVAIHELTGRKLEDVISETSWKPNGQFRLNASARPRSSQEVQRLIQGLLQQNGADRASSIEQLIWVSTPESLLAFARSLDDSDAFVRFVVLETMLRRAAIGMNESPPDELVEPLVKVLTDENWHVVVSATDLWTQFLKPQKEHVPQVRERVLPLLRNIAMNHPSGFARAAASKALLRAGSEDRMFWEARMNDEFVKVRELAQIGLGRFRN
jgi:HEAT repeat protein